MVIFHSYVSLPEGIYSIAKIRKKIQNTNMSLANTNLQYSFEKRSYCVYKFIYIYTLDSVVFIQI